MQRSREIQRLKTAPIGTNTWDRLPACRFTAFRQAGSLSHRARAAIKYERMSPVAPRTCVSRSDRHRRY